MELTSAKSIIDDAPEILKPEVKAGHRPSFMLEEKITRKSDNKCIKWTVNGLSNNQVKNIRVAEITGKNLYEFKTGRQFNIELEDVIISMQLRKTNKQ